MKVTTGQATAGLIAQQATEAVIASSMVVAWLWRNADVIQHVVHVTRRCDVIVMAAAAGSLCRSG